VVAWAQGGLIVALDFSALERPSLGRHRGRLFELAQAAFVLDPLENLFAVHGDSRRGADADLHLSAAHLRDELALEKLAEVAAFSGSHFRTLFKRSTGLPVHEYIIQRRVERARTLLLRRDLPASQIALEAGFAHQGHMARCMRRVLGLTPNVLGYSETELRAEGDHEPAGRAAQAISASLTHRRSADERRTASSTCSTFQA
jgi:AraC-like DNA-binding protein